MTSLISVCSANKAIPISYEGKLAISKIAVTATVVSIELIDEKVITATGNSIQEFRCRARLKVVQFLKNDSSDQQLDGKVLVIEFVRVDNRLYMGDQIPVIKVGDRVKVFIENPAITENEIKGKVGNVNHLEIIK